MKTSPALLFAALAVAPVSLLAQSSAEPPAAPATAGMAAPGGQITPTPGASDPVVGDPVNTVFSTLGRPNGVITNPDKSNLLMFERGTVVIADGKVTEVKLMPMATYNAKLAAEASVEADRQANAARSNALLQGLLADPAYAAMSTRDRMAVLTKFDREHPGSDAKKYLADLTSVYSAEQLVQSHIADLQNQVNQARAQATMYQQQVQDAQQKLRSAQENQAILKAQADAARNQAAAGGTAKSPFVTTTTNSAPNTVGSKVGQGGSVLAPNGFGTVPAPIPAPAPAPVAPAVSAPPASTAGHWVVEADGVTARFVPSTPGS